LGGPGVRCDRVVEQADHRGCNQVWDFADDWKNGLLDSITPEKDEAEGAAHSGEPAEISGYPGKSDKFDEAIAEFATAYADQTERDYQFLKKAVRDGKLEASE